MNPFLRAINQRSMPSDVSEVLGAQDMYSLTERLVSDQSINQYQHQNLETGFTSGTPGRLIESNFNCGVVFEAKRQEVLHQA
jgi:hypothetical protein